MRNYVDEVRRGPGGLQVTPDLSSPDFTIVLPFSARAVGDTSLSSSSESESDCDKTVRD
jgi:hypothetical protein